MRCTRVNLERGHILVADIEELEQMDAPGIHAKRLNAKELLTHKNGETILYFQSQMEQLNSLEEIRF